MPARSHNGNLHGVLATMARNVLSRPRRLLYTTAPPDQLLAEFINGHTAFHCRKQATNLRGRVSPSVQEYNLQATKEISFPDTCSWLHPCTFFQAFSLHFSSRTACCCSAACFNCFHSLDHFSTPPGTPCNSVTANCAHLTLPGLP